MFTACLANEIARSRQFLESMTAGYRVFSLRHCALLVPVSRGEAFMSLTHRIMQVRGQAPVGCRRESRRRYFLSGPPQLRRAGCRMRRWLLRSWHDQCVVRGNQHAPRPLTVAYAHDHSPTPPSLHGRATQSCQRHGRWGFGAWLKTSLVSDECSKPR